MMSTSLNHASVLASLMESHFQELDLIPEQLLLNKEEMLPILQKCFSAHRIKPGPVDSAFIKDCVGPVDSAFIKIVHCFHVFKVMEDMGLGTNPSSFFMPPAPHEVFPTPAPGWRPGQAMADGKVP